jgi:hypothetical protein
MEVLSPPLPWFLSWWFLALAILVLMGGVVGSVFLLAQVVAPTS